MTGGTSLGRGLAVALVTGLVAWPTATLPAPLAAQDPLSELMTEVARGPRVPVLLVPGWRDDSEQLDPLRRRFVEAGWTDSMVATVSFEDPVGSNRAHAREINLAVTDLLQRTGASRIDVVAHSMGGLALRYFLQNGGHPEIRRVVFLATPHRGTWTANLAWGEGGEEMKPGSPFLLSLIRFYAVPPGVEGITVRTPVDLHVLPPESAALPPLPDIEICCPTHAGLLDHDGTFDVIETFLRKTP